jgi:hypothetical protein
MIVRINQLDTARAELESGWTSVGPCGPIRPAALADARVFELLILDMDEQNRPLPDGFRQAQLRQMIAQALAALREPGEELVVRMDGPMIDGELGSAVRWLVEPDGRGRFALSGVQKLDDRAVEAPGSLRIQPSLLRLASICADAAVGLDRLVRLRAFLVPEAMVNSVLTLVSVDDERWTDIIRQAGVVLSTTRGLRSLHLYTRRFDAATVKARVMQRLMSVAAGAAF